METLIHCLRVAAVVILLCISSAIATPPRRLPLALRGLKRILQKDKGLAVDSESEKSVSATRKIISILLLVLAVFIALYR